MNSTTFRLDTYGARVATLLGSASLMTIAGAIAHQDRALAVEATVAQAVPEEIPENVLITGSLIRGTIAVGVPVVNISPMDFANTGALTTADLFRNIGQANVDLGGTGTSSGARIERGAKVNIRGLDTGSGVRSLVMVDGIRFPPQSNGLCAIDPSVIPSIALDHIDILVDGASATYGSDAVSGVINLVLRRNYDGAMTQFRYTHRDGGGARYQLGQLWGRTWDGGQITMSYEWYEEIPTKGNSMSNFGTDHSPWGYDDRRPIGSSTPGTITVGKKLTGSQSLGTQCGYNTGASPATPSRCYAIPHGVGQDFPSVGVGPLDPYSGSTFNWSDINNATYAGPITPSAGTQNIFDPYSRVYFDAAEQRNGGHFTVDQRLTSDISFYGSGFYSNRRSKYIVPSIQGPGANNSLTEYAVPTYNPYYPTGNAPTDLRVSYDINLESPAQVDAYELATRYQMGLNIALPRGWSAQVYYAETYDSSYNHVRGSVNKNAVSAALGWTIDPVPASGSAPSFGTWTKPANVPYLNLFCDPMSYKCNSDTTLNYIAGFRSFNERFWINEKGIKADGPLFDLPGGTVKAAIGVQLSSSHFNSVAQDNTGGDNLTINPVYDVQGRFVWATFAQINVPIFSEMNAIPFFARFDLEASWRHDQYSDVAGTSNPKIAFNWSPIEDFTIRGSWGTNFRAPNFGETSPVANVAIAGYSMTSQLATSNTSIKACSGAGDPLPAAASGAGKIQTAAYAFNNAMAAAGAPGYMTAAGCIDDLLIPDPASPYTQDPATVLSGATPLAPITAFEDPGITDGTTGLVTPQGIDTLGGSIVSIPIRNFTRNGLVLKPELATNWGIGIQYTPTNILRGLDLQATYYIIKITNLLVGFGNPNDTRFQDPNLSFAFPSPSDIGCPDLPNSVRPTIPIPANLVPSACAQWMTAVDGILSNPRAAVAPQARTLVYWINDGGTFNQGWLKVDGIDFSVSYDWDMGNIGAFNIGATGTYYLHRYQQNLPTDPVTDGFHTTTGSSNAQSIGVPTVPAFHYRGRLGWSNGPWSVTGFMDYLSHYYHTQGAPPNVNGNKCTASSFGAPAGGTYPCFQDNYNNELPPFYSFDLTVGYDTGDDPANDYLKNIGLQLIIQNLMDKHADYQYRTATRGGQPCTCDILRSGYNYGRQISFVITKTW